MKRKVKQEVKMKEKDKVKGILTFTLILTLALCAQAKFIVDISSSPVVQVRTTAVAGEAVSLLPSDKKWKLVWHDEFNGPEIDRTKWMCRESFWGADFPAFAHNFEGVEMTGHSVKLHLLRYANGKKIGEQNEPVSHVEQFILVSTEPRGYRNVGANDGGLTDGQRIWGKPDPKLFEVVLPDFFEVDFVRVYDAVENN